MIDPENINALEVLTHLKQLGYDNITRPQLNDFMHDLRKLIRYEQKYSKGVKSVSGDSSVAASTSRESRTTTITTTTTTDSSQLCTDCMECDTDSVCTSSHVIDDASCLTEVESKKKKQSSICAHSGRPKSSFIRPWRLQQSCKAPTSVTHFKSDPVQLYHKYKDLWAVQKVPGEKSHSQLRWTIRERMLGQDPHPRPVSQASTDHCSRSAYHKQRKA